MLVWHAQELPSSCVAAWVRMVLEGLGVLVAEAQVRPSGRIGEVFRIVCRRAAAR